MKMTTKMICRGSYDYSIGKKMTVMIDNEDDSQ